MKGLSEINIKARLELVIGMLLCLLAASSCRNDAAKLAPELDAIEIGYNATAGGKDFPRASFIVVVDDVAMERILKSIPGAAMYYDRNSGCVVAPTRPWFPEHGYPARWYTMSLAHELGHAMGLPHASQGLMLPQGDLTCIGREGACLYEAMAFAGTVLLLPED